MQKLCRLGTDFFMIMASTVKPLKKNYDKEKKIIEHFHTSLKNSRKRHQSASNSRRMCKGEKVHFIELVVSIENLPAT